MTSIPVLAAGASIVDPITITNDPGSGPTPQPPGSGASVCPTYGYTAGNLTYDYVEVEGSNVTNIGQSVPIGYNAVYANGAPCAPGNPVGGSGGSGGVGGGGGGGAGFTYNPPQQTQTQSVIETITLEIDQTLAVSREAFLGTLDWMATGDSLTNVQFTPVITDLSGDVVGPDLFQVMEVSGPALDGTGDLPQGQSVEAQYDFIPSLDAAANGSTDYNIGGTLSFDDSSGQQTINLTPVTVDVLPQPVLNLDYFWSDDVLGPDPFNPQEPSQPFMLGVEVHNVGAGAADNLTITSAQPQIISNLSGLAVNFTIVGSAVDGVPAGDSLTANFGTVAAGTTDTAVFDIDFSLQGIFQNYQAAFKNSGRARESGILNHPAGQHPLAGPGGRFPRQWPDGFPDRRWVNNHRQRLPDLFLGRHGGPERRIADCNDRLGGYIRLRHHGRDRRPRQDRRLGLF